MTLAEINYLEKQMFQVAPLPLTEEYFPHGFDIKVRSEERSTNWLRITPRQMKAIEDVLFGVNDE